MKYESIISEPKKEGLGETCGVKVRTEKVPPQNETEIVIENFWSSGNPTPIYIAPEHKEELIKALKEVPLK